MQSTNDKSHYTTLISSLNKEYLNVKLGKTLKPNNLYTLDIVYNLLNLNNLELSKEETRKLTSIYSDLINYAKNICVSNIKFNCELNTKKITIQSNEGDCVNIPTTTLEGKIYYWQENTPLIGINEIAPLTYNIGYFDNKASDSYLNFETIGKTIGYGSFGKICFYATKSNNQPFTIIDILNNNVTDVFDILYLQNSNATLFVSKDPYSVSNMFFKITKQ
jgi:hypothetical protein